MIFIFSSFLSWKLSKFPCSLFEIEIGHCRKNSLLKKKKKKERRHVQPIMAHHRSRVGCKRLFLSSAAVFLELPWAATHTTSVPDLKDRDKAPIFRTFTWSLFSVSKRSAFSPKPTKAPGRLPVPSKAPLDPTLLFSRQPGCPQKRCRRRRRRSPSPCRPPPLPPPPASHRPFPAPAAAARRVTRAMSPCRSW